MATQPKEHIAETLLQRAHSPDTAANIHRERVKQRPLLLRPTSPDPTQNARAKRQYERLQKERKIKRSSKPRPLSAKRKRALCIYDIPKEQQKYAIYEPLHEMWCGYMRDILGLSGESKRTHVDSQAAGPMLVSADYHGALVEIVRTRCTSRVGLKGIVVKDTKFTFEIVTRRNELKKVPKEHTVFRFELPLLPISKGSDQTPQKPLVFEIYGSQFETRAPDRANKKFKMHIDPGL